MSERWQIRRGTTAENNQFTGAQGELTMDTQKKQLRVHDGSTQGGAGTIDPIVAYQLPSSNNDYKWYRKYASGWVEQGGIATISSDGLFTVTYPVPMASGKPQAIATPYNQTTSSSGDNNYICMLVNIGTTTMQIRYFDSDGSAWRRGDICWRVEGMAA